MEIYNNLFAVLTVILTLYSVFFHKNLLSKIIPLVILGFFLKIQIWGLPLALPEIFTLTLFFGLLFKDGIKIFKLAKPILLPMSLILIGFCISTYVAMQSGGSIRDILGVLKGFIVLPFLFFISTRQLDISFDRLWKNFNSIFTLYFLGLLVSGLFGFGVETYFNRLQGLFTNPNYLAMLVAPIFTANVIKTILSGFRPKYCWYKNLGLCLSKRDVLQMIIIVIQGFTLFWTQSYGAMVGVMISLFLTFFIFFPSKRKIMGVYTLLILIFAISVLSSTMKFRAMLDLENRSSSSSRVQIWTVALIEVKDNFLFGIGPKQYERVFNRDAKTILGVEPYESKVPHPHNQYLDFILSFGLVGFIGFMSLLYIVLKRTYLLHFPMLFGFILTLCAHGLFDTWYSKIDNVFIIFFIFALVFNIREHVHNTKY